MEGVSPTSSDVQTCDGLGESELPTPIAAVPVQTRRRASGLPNRSDGNPTSRVQEPWSLPRARGITRARDGLEES